MGRERRETNRHRRYTQETPSRLAWAPGSWDQRRVVGPGDRDEGVASRNHQHRVAGGYAPGQGHSKVVKDRIHTWTPGGLWSGCGSTTGQNQQRLGRCKSALLLCALQLWCFVWSNGLIYGPFVLDKHIFLCGRCRGLWTHSAGQSRKPVGHLSSPKLRPATCNRWFTSLP